MLLFCKYGVDPSDPSVGFVLAHYDDDKVPTGEPHPGCLAMSYTGQVEALGRYAKDPTHFAAPRLTVAVAQSSKVRDLKAACRAAIVGGFTSSALGSANAYPSDKEDQRNLNTAVNASLMGQNTAGWTAPVKCGPSLDKATRTPHDAKAVHAAMADFIAAKDGALAKLDGLKAKALAATTLAAVAAVAWG